MKRGTLRLTVIGVVVVALGWQQHFLMEAQAQDDLKIVVVEGEDGVNIIDQKTAVKPIVEIRDRNNLPVAGAAVTFTITALATGGGSSAFAGGQSAVTITTDAAGRAVAGQLQPLRSGAFRIDVRAAYRGQTATTSVNQTNFQTAADALKAGKTPGSSRGSEASNSSGQAGSQAGQASASAGGASGGGSAAGSSAAAGGAGGGGMGAVGQTVLWSGLAAGGAVGGKYAYDKFANSCNAQEDQAMSSLETQRNVCAGGNFNSCVQASQTAFNALDAWCACEGPSGDPEVATMVEDLRRNLAALGIAVGSSCR